MMEHGNELENNLTTKFGRTVGRSILRLKGIGRPAKDKMRARLWNLGGVAVAYDAQGLG
jgi:hypothetical protein